MTIDIPTIEIGKKKNKFYTNTIDKEKWIEVLESEIFKEPGYYNITKEIHDTINSEAVKFTKHKTYCDAPFKSNEFIEYWEKQKLLSRNGLLIIHDNQALYVPRDYYFWINFLPIYRKDIKKFGFADVIDFQIHMALYEYIAELKGLDCAITKKRQCASSYFHAAKIINQVWFEEGVILKIAAYAETYLKSIWSYLDDYKAFLNDNTGWYRHFLPDKYREWKQQYTEVTPDGAEIKRGLKGQILGIITDTSGMKSVSGPCRYFFNDEAGISPVIQSVHGYVQSSIRDGEIVTGQFIAAGSVGELEYSTGLRDMMINHQSYNIYGVNTKYFDEDMNERRCGLFIPEQWGMRPYIDEYGNSQVNVAIDKLIEMRRRWKKELNFEIYQLRVSQRPMFLAEAFAYRKESRFPLDVIKIQENRILDKKIFIDYVDLEMNEKNEVHHTPSKRPPINTVPVPMTMSDKRGCVVVYEYPLKDLPFGSYVASVDPVSAGKTIYSNSLASIYVYRMPTEVKTYNKTNSEIKSSIEGDKLVCSWAGRYDNFNDTCETLLKIIKWYKAKTIVENNSWNFIQYMISKRETHWLVPSNQILFTKELNLNVHTYKEYGFSMSNNLFDKHLIPNLIDFIKEKIGEEYDEEGNVKRIIYGIERIPDIMVLEEMKKFEELENTDRLVTLAALVAYIRILTSNFGYVKISKDENNFENINKIPKFNYGYFNMPIKNKYRSYFKHLR